MSFTVGSCALRRGWGGQGGPWDWFSTPRQCRRTIPTPHRWARGGFHVAWRWPRWLELVEGLVFGALFLRPSCFCFYCHQEMVARVAHSLMHRNIMQLSSDTILVWPGCYTSSFNSVGSWNFLRQNHVGQGNQQQNLLGDFCKTWFPSTLNVSHEKGKAGRPVIRASCLAGAPWPEEYETHKWKWFELFHRIRTYSPANRNNLCNKYFRYVFLNVDT